MTILDALKGLYAKLGGKKSPDNIQTIGEALEDITTVTVNGSDVLPAVTAVDNGDVLTVVSGEWAKAAPTNPLPSVTSDDNGDVLTVVEGAWAKAAPSGGGDNVFVIRGTTDEQTHTVTMDKTVQEIITAANAGKMLWVYMPLEGSLPGFGPVVHIFEDSGVYTISVACNYTLAEDDSPIVKAAQFVAESLTDYPSI